MLHYDADALAERIQSDLTRAWACEQALRKLVRLLERIPYRDVTGMRLGVGDPLFNEVKMALGEGDPSR